MTWAWKQQLDPTTKFVLVALSDHANDVDFTCWPSLTHLQIKTGYSRPTIWKAIDRLSEIGAMVRVGLHASGATLYRVQVGNDVTLGNELTQVSTLPKLGNVGNKLGNVGNKVGNDVTPNHKNHNESSITIMSGKPDDVSLNVKNKVYREEAKQALAFLNEKTGSAYRAVDTNLKLIESILKSGVSLEDIRTVTMRKVRDWRSDPKMAAYLRPSTLYRRSNFEQYLGQTIKPEVDQFRGAI